VRGAAKEDTVVTITGNTYPVKEQIKALGGRWNKAAQGWDVPEVNAEAARKLVESAGPSTYQRTSKRSARYGSTYTRFSSGAEVFTNRRGRCEDAPCCGCCS
jgi:hypothetical protein